MEAGVRGDSAGSPPLGWPRLTPRWRGDLGLHTERAFTGEKRGRIQGQGWGFLGELSLSRTLNQGCHGLDVCVYPVGNLLSVLETWSQPPSALLLLSAK